MPYSVKGLFEINEDMVQKGLFEISEDMVQLLMLETLFTQDSKVEDFFLGAPSSSEPSLFIMNYLSSAWGLR